MHQLRIALISSHSCPWAIPGNRYTGGMNIYIQNLARELAQRGHLVHIYTASHTDDEKCVAADLHYGIRLIHLKASNFSAVSETNIDDHVSDFATSIKRHAVSINCHYDIIHSHYWLSGLIGDLLSKSWGIPHITMFHTLAKLKNMAGIGALEPEFRIRREKWVIDNCDLIIASTQKEKHELIYQYGAISDNIAVIPCGICTALFRPFDKYKARKACKLGSKQTILFVGRMDPLKGLANLLLAASILKNKREFQLLVIGGDGENDPEYQRMLQIINEYKINDIVLPLGSIPHQDMYLYYNSADFCIIPSYYESFSLVALESLACGIPIVSTDVGEVSDMVRICGGCKIIPDNSPQSLASNMDAMFDNTAPVKIRNDIFKTRYGWDSVAEKVMDIYAHFMSTCKAPKQTLLTV